MFIGNGNILLVLLFSSLHECAHLAALIAFGEKPIEINFAFYGIGLKHRSNLPFIKELIFLLSGAFLNFILFFFNINREINYPLAIINIMPLYPLDGGRAVKLILNRTLGLFVSDNIFKAFSVIGYLALLIFSIINRNISLLLISVYILIFSLNNSFE
ncbi:MAG: site-2 protease family protein [Eubacterium sp.]|nr:site-2 protease family protein [Eubacterium sp.]